MSSVVQVEKLGSGVRERRIARLQPSAFCEATKSETRTCNYVSLSHEIYMRYEKCISSGSLKMLLLHFLHVSASFCRSISSKLNNLKNLFIHCVPRHPQSELVQVQRVPAGTASRQCQCHSCRRQRFQNSAPSLTDTQNSHCHIQS